MAKQLEARLEIKLDKARASLKTFADDMQRRLNESAKQGGSEAGASIVRELRKQLSNAFTGNIIPPVDLQRIGRSSGEKIGLSAKTQIKESLSSAFSSSSIPPTSLQSVGRSSGEKIGLSAKSKIKEYIEDAFSSQSVKTASLQSFGRLSGSTIGQSAGKSAAKDFETSFKANFAANFLSDILRDSIYTAFNVVRDQVGSTVGLAMDFERQISSIRALGGLTADQVNQIKQLSFSLGSSTSFSALEAAQSIEELYKSGLNFDTIMGGGAQGTLDLAAAGDISPAEAATISSVGLNAYRKENLTVANIADTLAGAANASATDVGKLKMALSQAAAGASAAGLTFDDTNTALAVLSQNFLQGSDAGTSLKTFLLNLAPTVQKKAGLIEELGMDFFDANGNMKNFRDIVGELEEGLKDFNGESRQMMLKEIFGSDAYRAAQIFFEQGVEGFDNMNAEMKKFTAQQVAAERLDNLAGATERFFAAIDTIKIQALDAVLPLLKNSFNALADAVEGVSIEDVANALKDFVNNPLVRNGLEFLSGMIGTVLVGAFAALTMSILSFSVAWLTSPIGLVSLAIGGIVASVLKLNEDGSIGLTDFAKSVVTWANDIGINTESVKKWFTDLASTVVDFSINYETYINNWIESGKEWAKGFGVDIDGIINRFGDLWDTISKFAQDTWTWLNDTNTWLNDTFKKGEGVIVEFVKNAMEPLKQAWEDVQPFIQKVTDKFNEVKDSLAEQLKPVIDDFNNELLPNLREAWGKIIEVGNGLWLLITTMLTPVLAALGLAVIAVKVAWEVLVAYFNEHLAPEIGIVSGLFEALGTVITTVMRVAISVIGTAVSIIITAIEGIIGVVNGVIEVFNGFADILIGIFTGDAERVANGFASLFSGVGGVVTSVFNTVISTIEAAINGIMDMINEVLGAFGAVENKARVSKSSSGSWLQGARSSVQAQFASRGNDARNTALAQQRRARESRAQLVARARNRYAEGTPYSPAGLAQINERGQEIIYLPNGSKVIPREYTENIMNTSIASNNTVNNYGSNYRPLSSTFSYQT